MPRAAALALLRRFRCGAAASERASHAQIVANELGVDLSSTIRAKMVKNAQKYPANEFRGRFGRDDNGQFGR